MFLVQAETLPSGQSLEQSFANLGSRSFALEAALDDDEPAQSPALLPIGFSQQVAEAGGALGARRRVS